MGQSWEVKNVRTTCPYCGVGCQLNLHVKGEQIVKITGVEDGAPNYGRLCVKGRFGYDFIYSPDRLTTPLIREDHGEFRKASWDEALDLVANKFKEIIKESEPGASCRHQLRAQYQRRFLQHAKALQSCFSNQQYRPLRQGLSCADRCRSGRVLRVGRRHQFDQRVSRRQDVLLHRNEHDRKPIPWSLITSSRPNCKAPKFVVVWTLRSPRTGEDVRYILRRSRSGPTWRS